jgi:hypothetical protein
MTNEEIEQMQFDCAAAGDLERTALCILALHGAIDTTIPGFDAIAAALPAGVTTRGDARAAIEQVHALGRRGRIPELDMAEAVEIRT